MNRDNEVITYMALWPTVFLKHETKILENLKNIRLIREDRDDLHSSLCLYLCNTSPDQRESEAYKS